MERTKKPYTDRQRKLAFILSSIGNVVLIVVFTVVVFLAFRYQNDRSIVAEIAPKDVKAALVFLHTSGKTYTLSDAEIQEFAALYTAAEKIKIPSPEAQAPYQVLLIGMKNEIQLSFTFEEDAVLLQQFNRKGMVDYARFAGNEMDEFLARMLDRAAQEGTTRV